MKKSFKFLLVALMVLVAVASCTKKTEKVEEAENWYMDDRQSTTMQRTMTDTLAVLHNTKEYLNLLKANEVDSALNRLYTLQGDTVLPLTPAEREVARKSVTMFPVLDYEIESVKMFNEHNTEVHYNVKYFELDGDSTKNNKIQCVLQAVRVGYYWYLTLPQTNRQPDPGRPIDE